MHQLRLLLLYNVDTVVFGVSASPFQLNATIDHHIKKYTTLDKPFVSKFRQSIYTDDLTAGSHDTDSAYEFYVKSKLRLAEANFNLRKFDTNSPQLRKRIESNEQLLSPDETPDQTERVQTSSKRKRQVLGVRWDITKDVFIFDVSSIASLMKRY